MQILVSTDCGDTWELISEITGSELATTNPPGTSSPFYPTSSDWKTDTVNLTAYDGNSDVMISFKGICGGGNNLYLDDIVIDEMISITSINENENEIYVFPNPVKDVLNIEGNFTSLNMFDIFGRLVFSSKHTKNIDTSKFNNGIYFYPDIYK